MDKQKVGTHLLVFSYDTPENSSIQTHLFAWISTTVTITCFTVWNFVSHATEYLIEFWLILFKKNCECGAQCCLIYHFTLICNQLIQIFCFIACWSKLFQLGFVPLQMQGDNFVRKFIKTHGEKLIPLFMHCKTKPSLINFSIEFIYFTIKTESWSFFWPTETFFNGLCKIKIKPMGATCEPLTHDGNTFHAHGNHFFP